MKKITLHITLLIFVAVGFILTRAHWMNTLGEFITVSILIALAGIPHGSLDHKIALHRNQKLSLPVFLIQYIASALFYLAVWAMAPGIALILFLILTAWHFGETDFVIFKFRNRYGWLIFLYGWCLTMWLLAQDKAALTHWLNIITRESALNGYFIQFITYLPVESWFILLSLIVLINGDANKKSLALRFSFLLFLFLLSKTSLLTGFILYFAGWHSLNALSHIKTKVFKKTNVKGMIRQAVPATLAALFFLLGVAWLGNGHWLQNQGLPALFILLSILTLPHMTEMHRLYIKKR
jgi:Brp/Blh family beta-carotene 15,15'-monooxygenase